MVGALAGTGVALATWNLEGGLWILPLMIVAGVLGGLAYAAIPAFLKTRFNVNEILSSLMLTYVAIQLLYWLMNGPWKDPEGFNFPQTAPLHRSQMLPEIPGSGFLHIGVPLALVVALAVWFVMAQDRFRLPGPRRRRRAAGRPLRRLRRDRTIWLSLLVGGGLAGLAGIFEAAGPFGQMVPQFPTGYGFTAIIVAFLGRLHPVGIVLAGIVLAVTYVGGEQAQAALGLPSSATGVFQAMLLFFLLATDILVTYRLRLRAPRGRSRADGRRHHLDPDDRRRRGHAALARRPRRAGGGEVRRPEPRRRGHDADRRRHRLRRHLGHRRLAARPDRRHARRAPPPR